MCDVRANFLEPQLQWSVGETWSCCMSQAMLLPLRISSNTLETIPEGPTVSKSRPLSPCLLPAGCPQHGSYTFLGPHIQRGQIVPTTWADCPDSQLPVSINSCVQVVDDQGMPA